MKLNPHGVRVLFLVGLVIFATSGFSEEIYGQTSKSSLKDEIKNDLALVAPNAVALAQVAAANCGEDATAQRLETELLIIAGKVMQSPLRVRQILKDEQIAMGYREGNPVGPCKPERNQNAVSTAEKRLADLRDKIESYKN